MTRKERKIITKEIYDLVVLMFKDGKHNMMEISRLLAIHRQTVSKIIKDNEAGIDFVSADDKRKRTCTARNSVYQDIEQRIHNIVACNNSLVLSEIKDLIQESTKVSISTSTISRKMKKIGLTRKRLTLVPAERNTRERIEARMLYSTSISPIIDDNLIFLDETGFNEHSRRKYGYSPKNTKAYVTVPANRNVNRSLICVIDTNGVVSYEVKSRAYTSTDFMSFLSRCVIPYFKRHPSSVLVMNNARFHKTPAVQQLFFENNIAIKFLVPYSPELNPIEEFFSMIKSRYYAKRIENSTLTIEQCLNEILDGNNNYSSQCRNFYSNMRIWLEKARREEFI